MLLTVYFREPSHHIVSLIIRAIHAVTFVVNPGKLPFNVAAGTMPVNGFGVDQIAAEIQVKIEYGKLLGQNFRLHRKNGHICSFLPGNVKVVVSICFVSDSLTVNA